MSGGTPGVGITNSVIAAVRRRIAEVVVGPTDRTPRKD